MPQGADTPAKSPEGPQRLRADQRRTDGGGEETKPSPPPKQTGCRETMATKTGQRVGRGRQSRRSHSGARRRTTAVRRPCQVIPPALPTPGPSTARSCAARMAYWRRQGWQSTKPTRGTSVAMPAMGPHGTRTGGVGGCLLPDEQCTKTRHANLPFGKSYVRSL